ncbi:MAG: branched-chain amino acid ABC transporter permease [Bradyrhizobium sp.]
MAGASPLGPVSIGELQLIVIGVTIVLVAVIAYIVQRTSMGRALRAVAENRDVARLLGVSGSRITLTAFMMSGALAGAAGVLIAIHYAAITPYVGVEIGLKAIAVMVIGRHQPDLGRAAGRPADRHRRSAHRRLWRLPDQDFVVYGFMIAILLFRPQGTFGRQRRGSGASGCNVDLYREPAGRCGHPHARPRSASTSSWRPANCRSAMPASWRSGLI